MGKLERNKVAIISFAILLGVTALPILLAVILLVATAGFASGRSRQEKSQGERQAGVYPAALGATVGVVPGIAVLSTVVVYLVSPSIDEGAIADFIRSLVALEFAQAEGSVAVLIGSLLALIVWLSVGYVYRGSATANSVSPRNYSALRQQHGQLESQLEHLKSKYSNNIAYAQASSECEEIERGLKAKGAPWVKGTGYIELWQRVHRAEEALVMIEPCDAVIVGAMRDELRLMDSNMTHKDSLLERLRYAVAMMDGSRNDGHPSYLAGPPQNPPPKNLKDPAKAKSILSEVRYEINSFRDNVWEGIVHARNQLVATSVFTGFAAYALLALALIVGAPKSAVSGAALYFLVGAIVGLFSRLRIDAQADTAVDDYGLSSARLVHIPWFSGLAAVGGVLIVSVLDVQFLTQGDGSGTPGILSLPEIFVSNPSLLIVAAVFGLTPDLLIQRLTQQAERYKADLKSTETGQSSADLRSGGASPGAVSP